MEKEILNDDPFHSIDVEVVGYLVRKSDVEGKKANPNLSRSICGEQGGEPKSIKFFDEVGLDYLSCSPFLVPVSRLVVGQAVAQRPKDQHIRENTTYFEWDDSTLVGRFFHMVRLDNLSLWPFGHHRTPPKTLKKSASSVAHDPVSFSQ